MNISGGDMLKKKLLKNLIVFALFFLSISFFIFNRSINNFDELWNFNFALNISNGLVPYRDFNMLQTPFLPVISGILMKIVGKELLITRFLGALLSAGIVFISYKIFERLKVNSVYSISILMFLVYIYRNYFILDYNFLNLFIILMIIYREIINCSNKSSDFFYDFSIGLMLGTSILTKQSTGIIISFIACTYKMFYIKSKEDFFIFLKSAISRAFGILVPILIFAVYLLKNRALYYFIDYAILGVKTFSNSIRYISLVDQEKIVAVTSILIPIFFIVEIIFSVINKNKINSVFLFYSISSMIVIYPISDSIHFLIGAMPSFIFFSYFIYSVLAKIYDEEKNNSKETVILVKLLNEFAVFIFIYISIFNGYRAVEKLYSERIYRDLAHFRGIYMNEDEVQEIKSVENYILNNSDVLILDAYAAIYTIPIDKYDKNYSLFLKGNLGSRGEEGVIDDLEELNSDYKFLVRKDEYSRNWQTPEKVISYVKNNYTKKGEIEIFDIYSK